MDFEKGKKILKKSNKSNKNGNEDLSILLSTTAMAGVLVRRKDGCVVVAALVESIITGDGLL